MLQARNIHKHFKHRRLFAPSFTTQAVHDVTLELREGETVGLVGESGSGKSTLARCMASLEPITGGSLLWNNKQVTRSNEMRALQRSVQLIFQDPIDALNPKLTIEKIVTEPLFHYCIGTVGERRDKAKMMLERVGLHIGHIDRYPGELSRGQCQRVNIARALMADPRILICDEIISALDVSTGAQILRLLLDLQQEHGYGYLFISHDVARVMQISDTIAVMHKGTIVEMRPSEGFHLQAEHPYTQRLLHSVPQLFKKVP